MEAKKPDLPFALLDTPVASAAGVADEPFSTVPDTLKRLDD
jgi:hypothetical protein